ncbi:hypothetical protein [Niabella hibiscisoli]|uniref:hypothetical protein n=1 Tax=Niabella hibiscisoli TaxID=1825928 RepID=UPI001F100EA6|nr:hypothetical protein [Niabella hibiscisoli]MCH5714760.1 hypothetical protein [Niabella hibiscisoli]
MESGSMAATYNPKDSMMHIMAFGSNNERLTISFLKEPQYTRASKQFTANSMTPTCEYCASIAQQYSMDSLKQNSFQVMRFDHIKKRVQGKFSLYLKKDNLYQGTFVKDSSFFEGVFSAPFETLSF